MRASQALIHATMQVLTLVVLLGSVIVFCWLAEELYWEGRDDALRAVRGLLDKGIDARELKHTVIREIGNRPSFLRLGKAHRAPQRRL